MCAVSGAAGGCFRKFPLRLRTRSAAQGAPPGCAFFWLLFFAQAKKSDSRLRSRSESLCFQALASASFSKEKKFQLQEQELSLSFGERVTSLCLCKEKVTKEKAHPTSGSRCARLPSFHPCSRGPPRRAIPGPSRLSRHPCRSTPYATIPLGLLKGALIPVLMDGFGVIASRHTRRAEPINQ